MRSPWKKFYIDYNFKLLAKKGRFTTKQISGVKFPPLFIDNRAATVLKCMVGRKAGIHNGREYRGVTIKDEMIGHKFGEYVATRKVGIDMHFRKKGKKVPQVAAGKKKK